MAQSHEEIIRDISKKIYHPIYLLEGEEPYYIDLVSNFIESNVLPESERSFNQTVLYGNETTPNDIRQRALNYPMFSNYQVLIIKEAQRIKKWDEMLPYFEKPVETTILVLCHKYESFDKRTKSAKAIAANGIVMTTKKIYDDRLPGWISDLAKEKDCSIEPTAANLLAEYVGNDLSRIVQELEKLLVNLAGRKKITADDIEKNIGISKEYNVFELSKAIGLRDKEKAFRITYYLADNPKNNPLVVTLATLYNYFSKIYLLQKQKSRNDKDLATLIGVNPFFFNEYKTAVKNFPEGKNEQILHLLYEYDLRSKGINNGESDEGELLKEVVYKILH